MLVLCCERSVPNPMIHYFCKQVFTTCSTSRCITLSLVCSYLFRNLMFHYNLCSSRVKPDHLCKPTTFIISIHYFLLMRFIFVVIGPAWQVLRKHLCRVLPRKTVDSVEYSIVTSLFKILMCL